MSCWQNEVTRRFKPRLLRADIAPRSRRTGFRLAILAVALTLVPLLQACVPEDSVSSVERRAQALDQELMCPVCPGQSIAQSQVEYAAQMRAFVREKLAEGWTEEQIKQYYVERFGPQILMAPPRRGFFLVGWLGPFIALVVGGGLLAYVLKRLVTHRQSQHEETPPPAEPLPDEYLRRLEEELEAWE